MKAHSFILLGSNLGDSKALLKKAVELMSVKCGKIMSESRFYESEPWGFKAENNFINQAVMIETDLKPHDLLRELLSIEASLGRLRHDNVVGYESRPIDLDILYYDDLVVDDIDLILPHPRLHLRRFVLLPLCDIAPDFMHPIFRKTNKVLLKDCIDNSNVSVI